LIIGEPGIGKTALVETFVAQVRATAEVWVGHGQCVDQYGAGETYLPVLEALGRLGRGPEGALLVAVLRQYAPSWLIHLPALLASEDRERLEHLASSVTPARRPSDSSHQGACGPGSGEGLYPGAGAVPAGGRAPAALCRADGAP
jgi:hypothetical protein